MNQRLDSAEFELDERQRADLIGSIGGIELAVALKSMSRGTIEDMKGRLATAILQLRQTLDQEGVREPVVVLHAQRVGRRAIGELKDFMREYAPEFGWGAIDEQGSFHFELPSLDLEVDERGHNSRREARETKHNKRAFTDLNRWLLKLLMLRDAPERMWKSGEKYRRDIRNPNDLKDVADVSQAKAYQFARTFRDLGFLNWDREQFRIPDRRRLFELWYEEERQLRINKQYARSIFGPGAFNELIAKAEDEIEYAVGGYSACKLHGVLHTKPEVPRIHISGRPDYAMERLDLEPVAQHQADVCLVELPYSESVFRAAVTIDGMQVVDILQAALDSARYRGRGREQVEYIVEHVLEWKQRS